GRFMDDEDYLPSSKKTRIKEEESFDMESDEEGNGWNKNRQKYKYNKMQNRKIRMKTNVLPKEMSVDGATQCPIILDTPKGQIILKGSYAVINNHMSSESTDEASSPTKLISPGATLKSEVRSSGSPIMIQSVQGLMAQGNNEAVSPIPIGSTHFQGVGFILPKVQNSNILKHENPTDSAENKQKHKRSYRMGIEKDSDPSQKGWLKSWPPSEPKSTPDILEIPALPITDSKILINKYHMSIVPPGDNFDKFRSNIRKCSKLNPVKSNCKNCSLGRNAYHCPLCPHYKALSVTLFNRHVRIHIEPNRRCLHVRGFRIMNCKDTCKSTKTSHYHCPFCPTILEKMNRANYHIENCGLPKALQGKIKPTVKCPICSANLSQGSLAEHIRGQHGVERADPEGITPDRFHFTCLIDHNKRIFSSSKSFLGPGTPLHIILSDHEKFCESRQCMEKIEMERRLGEPDSMGNHTNPMCKHMLSVPYAEEIPQVFLAISYFI
ncbi:unnamed protein product, partial [Meganyctiphanes norvegica]